MKDKRIVQRNKYGFMRVELIHNGLGQIRAQSKFLDGSAWINEQDSPFSRRELIRGHAFASPDQLYCWQQEIDAQNVLRGIL